MQNLSFRMMALLFKIRDLASPRADVLQETGIGPGSRVLDFGCGPGSYLTPASEMVGEAGKVYALDIHPLAEKSVQRLIRRKRLTNVETIISDRKISLPDSHLDLVLLYDILHHLGDPGGVLAEIHRVLKPEGSLSVSDHHLKEDEIVSKITGTGLFRPAQKGKKTIAFRKT